MTCIEWAIENGVPPVARGGGHSYAGLSTTTGLLIDISRAQHGHVDQATGIAVVGGAALNATCSTGRSHAFLLPGGTCLGVGIGGLVLGGGIGYNAHWAGLTCDHLTSSRIVAAAGEVARDRRHQRPRPVLGLPWRRGRQRSGINTSFTFQLVEVPADGHVLPLRLPGADEAGAVLAEFNRVCSTRRPPRSTPSPWPGHARRQRRAARGDRRLHAGPVRRPADELQDLLAPMLAAATPTKTAFEEMPFWDVQQRSGRLQNPTPHSFGDISRYASEPLPDDVVAR